MDVTGPVRRHATPRGDARLPRLRYQISRAARHPGCRRGRPSTQCRSIARTRDYAPRQEGGRRLLKVAGLRGSQVWKLACLASHRARSPGMVRLSPSKTLLFGPDPEPGLHFIRRLDFQGPHNQDRIPSAAYDGFGYTTHNQSSNAGTSVSRECHDVMWHFSRQFHDRRRWMAG